MKKYFIVAVFSVLVHYSYGQDIITDTLIADFKPDTLIPFNLTIKDIKDNRTGNKSFISYSQTNKFILIPVDQEISTRRTLASELLNSLNSPRPHASDSSYSMEISYFLIERYNGRIFKPYVLRADLPLFIVSDTNKRYLGTLSYNLEYKPSKKKIPKTEICEEMLTIWHRELKLDFIDVENYRKNGSFVPMKLIVGSNPKPNYLNLSLASVIGLNFWQIEGEMFFTRPENSKNRWFISNIIRYQNNSQMEVISFGKKSEHFNSRINQNWLFDLSSNFLIGLNKWKISEDKTLYHLMNLSLSSNQSFNYDPKNKSGWLFKAGLFENIYFIIGMPPKLQIGAYLSVGYKF